VSKAQGVPRFVHDLLDRPVDQQALVCRQPIELVAQPMRRDHGSAPPQLCLTEDEREDGDKQVHAGDSDQSSPVSRRGAQDAGQDQSRVVLTPIGGIIAR
jgi:hypothetical protein